MTDVKVPVLPESVQDATIAQWHKQNGDTVQDGEVICELETDKIMLEVTALATGRLTHVQKEGDVVLAESIIGRIDASANDQQQASAKNAVFSDATKTLQSADQKALSEKNSNNTESPARAAASPSVRRAINQSGISMDGVHGTGKNGRITLEDVSNASRATVDQGMSAFVREEKRVPMTRMRAKIAERLMLSQKQTASLTTFNEIDMSNVMRIRSNYKDAFAKKYDTKLGFMSFFIKAASYALRMFPEVNASIEGNDIVYHGFCDIGVAVSTEKGLLVPIIRDAEKLSIVEIEQSIIDFAGKAKKGAISLDDLSGGTFSVTNGGVFGSMLSTPILNPPQSAILGMHNIVKRPVARGDEVVVRPIMYLALTYDHRIIDGRQAVSFLVEIKNMIEDPIRLLLEA